MSASRVKDKSISRVILLHRRKHRRIPSNARMQCKMYDHVAHCRSPASRTRKLGMTPPQQLSQTT
eukprot:scaffold14182_cov123-Skeletonema_dohrnii-CCMP3373.AAC.3